MPGRNFTRLLFYFGAKSLLQCFCNRLSPAKLSDIDVHYGYNGIGRKGNKKNGITIISPL